MVALGVGVLSTGIGAIPGGAAENLPGQRVAVSAGMALLPLAHSAVAIPEGAALQGPVPTDQVINGQVALASRDPQGLGAFVAAVSQPGGATYGDYLSPGQFAGRFGATTTVVQATEAWLGAHGLQSSIDADGLFVRFSGPASSVDGAFATTLDRFTVGGAARFAPQGAVSAPAALAGAVTGVVGLQSVAVPQSNALVGRKPQHAPASSTVSSAPRPDAVPAASRPVCQEASAQQASGSGYTPATLAEAYQIDGLEARGDDGSGTTVALYELGPYSPSDIAAYSSCFGGATSITDTPVDGGAGVGPGTGEADLDIETVAGLAPGAHLDVYSGPEGTDAQALDVYQRIANDDTAQVVSTSWGMCEAEAPSGYVTSENLVFEQMAAQGQTVVAASGDSGSEGCYMTSLDMSLSTTDPASQPYVTAAGGTSSQAPGSGSFAAEEAWNTCWQLNFTTCAQLGDGGATGGGLSSSWSQPSSQHGVTPAGGTCGTTYCRAVPDVAANADPADGDLAFWDGDWIPMGGTSAAAPLWAALLADVSTGCAQRLGFVNPALYHLAADHAGFNDITTQGNDYTNGAGGEYAAGPGYDLATGLGTPAAAALASGLQPVAGCPAVAALSASGGNTGTQVRITGFALASASSVHFGATPAHYSVNPDGSITATAPAVGPQTVPVTVTTADGTSGDSAGSAYSYGESPSVSSVQPGGSRVAGGGSVVIHGDHLAGVSGVAFGTDPARFQVVSDTEIIARVPGSGVPALVNVTVSSDGATSWAGGGSRFWFDYPGTFNIVHGYWEAAADGGVFAEGDDTPYYGSMGGQPLNSPIAGMAAAPDGGGYWLVAADGGIFCFGDAQYFGSMGAVALTSRVVGMATTADGGGYWMVAADGGVFAFGDAQFSGSMGAHPLVRPIAGMAATPDGGGYWLVAADGGIFAFGDAQFSGSMGGHPMNAPVVGMASSPDGGGYWLMGADGGMFSFGDAVSYGSAIGQDLGTMVGFAAVPPGVGYWLLLPDGTFVVCGGGVFEQPNWATPASGSARVGFEFSATPFASGTEPAS